VFVSFARAHFISLVLCHCACSPCNKDHLRLLPLSKATSKIGGGHAKVCTVTNYCQFCVFVLGSQILICLFHLLTFLHTLEFVSSIRLLLMFIGLCNVNIFQYISNKMQLHTVYLYLETALHVSGGTSTHHQELSHCYSYLPLAAGGSNSATTIRCCRYSCMRS
jgi:hypothetical protein